MIKMLSRALLQLHPFPVLLCNSMASHKPSPTAHRGSFGGMNRSDSALATGGADHFARQCVDSASSTTNSSSFLVRQEEFPTLGAPNTSSSASTKSNDFRTTQRKNSVLAAIPIVQTEDTSGPSNYSSINAGRSHNFHNQADGDEDALSQPRRVSKGNNYDNRSKSESKGYQKEFRDAPKSEGGRKFFDRGGQDRIYYLGRLLTSILRHRAIELNLPMRDDGYVVVQDLLKLGIKTQAGLPLSVYTIDDVHKAVQQDNKQRFGLLTENGSLLIRANQGHSIKVDSDKLLKPILSADEVSVCVHGTYIKNLDSILKNGLNKMKRNHVHFASGLPGDDGIISGMRKHCEVLIYLDVEKALKDGMKLYISENGVILTEGFNGVVPPKYFAQVAKWRRGTITPVVIDSQC